MGQDRKDQERLAQIEKEIEREDLTEIELMCLELEALTIRSKALKQAFETLQNFDYDN